MILPKAGVDGNELYLQLQNQLRLQNRELISKLVSRAGLSTDKVVLEVSSEKSSGSSKKKRKKTKKTFEDASTNTEGGNSSSSKINNSNSSSSNSDEGYR